MGRALGGVAALLLTCALLLTLLSRSLDPPPGLPINWLFLTVIMMVVAGIGFMALPCLLERIEPTVKLLLFVLIVGLALRLLWLPSVPILEKDYQRYL